MSKIKNITILGALCSALCLPATKVESLPSPVSRVVVYHDADIVRISALLRYQIVLQLPKDEEVMQVSAGDQNYWPADWVGSVVWVKPALVGARTNLNVLCTSGHVYSFLLTEVTGTGQQADLRVVIQLASPDAVVDHPKYVPVSQLAACEKQVSEAQLKIAELDSRATTAVPIVTVKTATALPGLAIDNIEQNHEVVADYAYSQEKAKKLHVTGIVHDKQFTYIQAEPQELFAVYAFADGKDHLVQSEFDPATGRYRVAGIMDKGYLRIGKTKFKFVRKGEA